MADIAGSEPDALASRRGLFAAVAVAVVLAFAVAYLGTRSAYVIAGGLVLAMLVMTMLRPCGRCTSSSAWSCSCASTA